MKVLTGNEKLTNNGVEVNARLIDFWAWNTSDLLNNTLRGAFAEFIVATACGIDTRTARVDWDAYDLKYGDIRIEVKSAAYLQSWEQKRESKIRFSIAPAREWSAEKWYDDNPLRHSDVYVFCLFSCKDRKQADVLKMEQWKFYVLATEELNVHAGNKKSIGISQLGKLSAVQCGYQYLKETIDKINDQRRK